MKTAPFPPGVQPGGLLDHRGRQVHAVAQPEVIGERLRQAADATAEVKGPPTGDLDPMGVKLGQDLLDIAAAGGQELTEIPDTTAFVGCAEDRPQRIVVAQRIPVLLQGVEFHPSLSRQP